MFAPDCDQLQVIDHSNGKPSTETRNVLAESARIARGNIQSLSKLEVTQHDVLIIPGGFGVAKNLSNWAIKGKSCIVNQEVEDAIKEFHAAGKPIGLCCIAPVLAAKLIPGCELTVGYEEVADGRWPFADTTKVIKELGCQHVCKDVHETHVDTKNKLVTTSAFMCNAELHEIFDGIGKMVKEVLDLA
ncbi:glutamine amidotransferase-like class 1 domain-containing protein 3, mitochondrial isoform X2 [Heptranchias perlo]